MGNKNDAERESKLITELRKKNRKLAIQNQQLRKQLRLLQDQSTVDPFEDKDVEFLPPPREDKNEDKMQCPKCGSYTKNIFVILDRRYYRCECGSKGRVNQ